MDKWARWRKRAHELKNDVRALYRAAKDPRTPWYARVVALCVVGYAFSPIDLIPDPIPILGYLDDLILIPLGIALALKFIPAEILDEHRAALKEEPQPTNWLAAGVIVLVWLLLAILVIRLLSFA